MRLTTFIILAAFMQVSAATFAQKVTINQTHTTLKEFFNQVHDQTGYTVLWSASDVNTGQQIEISLKDTPLPEALDKALEHTNLEYTIENKTVVIHKKEPGLLDKIKSAIGAPVSVAAIVYNELGEPMPGVNVRQKGTQNGTTTDSKGNFSITVPDNNTILVFSFVGYENQELAAKDIPGGSIVTLKVAENNLKEVVINKGYYDEKRELSTSDITIVSSREIGEEPISNPLQALEGRVPGLVITESSGLPGAGITVQIRGQNSIINGNNPFYVVDGVPYNAQLPGNTINGLLNGGSPLDFINPYDIENIEVLKDADATAIYGSRAANGAILITTKKGKAGKMQVDVNMFSGVTSAAHDVTLMNTQQYLAMRHQAFANDGETPNPNSDFDLTFWDTTRYTNWSKVLLGNPTHFNNAQASLSGGTTNVQYLIGADYSDQLTGMPRLLPGQGGDQKGSVHFNIGANSANQRFKVILSGNFMSDRNTVQDENFSGDRFVLPPDAPPIFNADGTLNWAPVASGQVGTWNNPFALLYSQYQALTSNLVSNSVLSYSLLPGLELKSSFGYSNFNENELKTLPTIVYDPNNSVAASSQFNTMSNETWIIEPQVNYQKSFGRLKVGMLIGTTIQSSISKDQDLNAKGFSSDNLLQNIGSATSINVSNSSYAQYKYNSLYGRLNLNLGDKYLLNLTARRDGSSRFGPGRQFGNFGAAGAAWVFSNENWVKSRVPFLSTGKIRASYGTSGNDQVGDYRYIDLYKSATYPYENIQGLYPGNLFNPNLEWEIDKKLEVGFELGFLNDRIQVTGDYFRNRSGNQLVNTPVSIVTGFTIIASNLPALVQNSGDELSLNIIAIKSSGFNWSTSFNLSVPSNKLISFPGLASSPYANQLIIGQPLSIQKVVHFLGVDPATGLYVFADSNGPTSNPNYSTDRISLVNTTPRYYGGFQNSFSYKGFGLDILFQFVKQTGLNINGYTGLPGGMYNEPTAYLNNWQKPGDMKPYEQFTQDFSTNAANAFSNAEFSDWVYSDASFIRLKNMAFSWQLPIKWVQAAHIQRCRLYVQGQNLLTITKYFGIDPESQNNNYPLMKVWTAGFQVTL